MIDFKLLRHLHYFLAVADERHFGRAAKRLGMSQPPLSQQIQVLEKAIGAQLFSRSRKTVTLTREGAAILAPVQRFMEHAQRMQEAIADARHGRSDLVAIGATNSAMFEIMPTLIRTAKRIHPELAVTVVQMQSGEAMAAVASGEIDIALARSDTVASPLEIRPVARDHLVLALPYDHRLIAQDRVKLADLAGETFVLFPRRSSPSSFDQITSACREAGFSPRLLYEVPSAVSQIAYVGCGVAIGLVPSHAMRFGGPNVAFRPLVETIDVVSIAAVWDPSRQKRLVPSLVELASRIGAQGGGSQGAPRALTT